MVSEAPPKVARIERRGAKLVSNYRFFFCLLAGSAFGLVACDAAQEAGQAPAEVSSQARGDMATDAGLMSLAERLGALQHRKTLVEDAAAIKRLQRAYGYYLDEALWDEIVDLFAEDGTIEIGLDGVYVGKERVRDFLYALGGGRSGLRDGQINEHMQLMPVVTVAPDGMTARGRWRALIMAGELGGDAVWGEGPYENEYVKEDGVWKLGKLHWFQSIVVPYEGGWQVNDDVNGGKWVSDRLPPDRPSTIEYDTWPSTYLPPFHFPNPVAGAESPLGQFMARRQFIAGDASLETLAAQAGRLEQEIAVLEDENAIENLQRTYGFYIDKGLWSQAADLFAADGTIEIGNSGVYVGKDRVVAYLRTRGAEFPQEGRLADRMQLQPIVHVAPDRSTARGRWRLFEQDAVWGEYANWGTGIYENEYVREDGVWKIQRLHMYSTMSTPYEDGWGKTALADPGPSEALPPDRPASVPHDAYPAVFVAPFHYGNPVTGAPVHAETAGETAAAVPADRDELESALESLETRVVRLEDMDALERLNAIYGYYLARNQWDNLAGIFASDGSIEIALRGVYTGSASVRRNLNLYGEAGIHHGLLHNHMQYQPVIHIAGDGQTAKMRSRAFSIMGEHETYSMWMGGTYENDYVKEDGIWKMQRDQVFNTYFVPYAVGWKDAVPRPPPGISESNPPDSPPTHPFQMYPSAFLPPFHYPNPVTGNEVTWTGE